MKKIGNYTVIEHVGHGAMGSVEKARSPNGDIVAIKILYPQFALEADYVKRFKREAKLARKLSHPNVVKILDLGEDAETHRPFIVMEYIEGQSLSEILHDTGMTDDPGGVQLFSPGETIRILRQLAGVLQAADDLGLVHRDIKPQNIILDWSGNAKLLDFGFAKDVDSLLSVLSVTGQPIGTPPYMSPEQHEANKEIDIRSDLYSLGCTAYQMLTGIPPFIGPSGAAFARQHCDDIPVPVVKRNADCPLNLSQVIDRLLAKNPADRHQTPAELIEDLNRVERGEVPVKLHKAKKSRVYTPKYTYIIALLVALVCMGLFYGHIKYRSMNAESVIQEAIAHARQLAIKHDYDGAKAKLDVVIAEYTTDNPDLVVPAVALRETLLKEYAIWRAQQESLLQQDKITRAVKAEEDQVRQRELAEQNRQRELHNMLRNAERWGKDESRVKTAAALIEKAYNLCNTDAERAQVAVVAVKVNEALAKRRPWAVLADFTIDDSVKASITGSAIAVKLEQVIGREFRLVTRRQISKALEELRFRSSDLVDRRKAERFGKYVGAEYLITGNVVQLGREITVAVQCLDIETGEICRTAEVSAVDVDDFNYMIREAAEILNMSDEKKRSYLDIKYKYEDAVQEGLKSFNSGDYVHAVKKFKEAQAIKPSKDIKELMDRAERSALGQQLREDSKERYKAAIQKALYHLNNKRWHDAEKYCRIALNIRGFEKDSTALDGLSKARAGILELNRNNAIAACEQILKSANSVYRELKKKGSGATNGYAKCAAQKSKIEQLRKSRHWKYLSQAKRDTVDKIYKYFNSLGQGYISINAERQFEQVYESILTEFRGVQNTNSSQSYAKYSELLNKLKVFIASSSYNYLSSNDKRSLMELKNLITEYQSKQNYETTYINGRSYSYWRKSKSRNYGRNKNKSLIKIYNRNKPSKGNVVITVNGRSSSSKKSPPPNTSASNSKDDLLGTEHLNQIFKPKREPARIRH
jgi:Protein kinase domain/Peptidoglycan-synthase activator LpoB